MAGGGGSAESGEPEFQVAPMIDVLLVILVFFMMITSAQVLKVDQTIKLPVAKHGEKKPEDVSEGYINVAWIGGKKVVKFEDSKNPIKPEDLIPILRARVAKDKKYRVVIRASREMPAGQVSELMDICGQAGLSDVSFAAINRD